MTTLLTRLALAFILLAAAATQASAYNTFPFFLPDGTGYLKWGDNHAGTPGGVVTWSLMPAGTTINPAAYEATYIHGTSNLTPIFNQVGGQAAALALIQSALDGWSQIANITFMYVGVDDGTPFAAPKAPGQVLGEIRIGGFEIGFDAGGVGYAPSPNGESTLGGDLILNNRPDIAFYNAPGAEGALYDLFPPGGGFYRNDFTGLVSHELGHALGLAHAESPGCLMCGYVSPEFDGSQCAYYDPDHDGRVPINRLPDPDDAAGAQFLYNAGISADFNDDHAVDGDDFLAWQRGLGMTTGADSLHGDANNDDAVSALDLSLWRNAYGTPPPAVAAVGVAAPEPGAAAMLLALVAASCLRCPSVKGTGPSEHGRRWRPSAGR